MEKITIILEYFTKFIKNYFFNQIFRAVNPPKMCFFLDILDQILFKSGFFKNIFCFLL